tara:strand:- start:10718 stop:11314 length:597 start_codon:yes stop_codon:yes gene_type:complete
MISIYHIKPKFQKLLQPIVVKLRGMNVTPNMITLFSIFFSIMISYFLWISHVNSIFYLFVSFGLLIRMALNAIDGMMARQYHLQSKTGEILNEIGDVISDSVIYFSIISFSTLDIKIAIVFIIMSIFNEFCGLLSKVISGERRFDGPMGKSDRAFLLGFICIIFYFTDILNSYMNYIIGFSSILIVFSSYLRIIKSIK